MSEVEAVGWKKVLNDEDASIMERYQRKRSRVRGPQRTALILIDVVESFVGPNVPVAEAQEVSRTACGERAWAAIPQILRILEYFRNQSWPVLFTVVSPEQRVVGAATRGETRKKSPLSAECVIQELAPTDTEWVFGKNRASVFFATPLVPFLVQRGITRLVLVGCSTSGCVRASAVDGTSYGFDVKVVEDATFDRVARLHDGALFDIDAKYGEVVSTADLLETLRLELARPSEPDTVVGSVSGPVRYGTSGRVASGRKSNE